LLRQNGLWTLIYESSGSPDLIAILDSRRGVAIDDPEEAEIDRLEGVGRRTNESCLFEQVKKWLLEQQQPWEKI
jgi:hypothetical protein